ncbi:MAG: hypothetical protein KDK34_06780 [Leptospiraceae bacterium]|nr:hypothetical protein [Leptospiraceae bacterium]
MIWVAIAISVCLGAAGQIFMKIAMRAAGPFPGLIGVVDIARYFWGAILSWPMLAAIVSYGISYVVWLGVLSRADLTLARPMVSLGYIMVILYGFYAGERMGWERVLGIVLIMIGLFLVVRSGARV